MAVKAAAFTTKTVLLYREILEDGNKCGGLDLKKRKNPGLLVHNHNPHIQEAEAGGLLQVQSQFGIHNKYQESKGCTARLRVKKT